MFENHPSRSVSGVQLGEWWLRSTCWGASACCIWEHCFFLLETGINYLCKVSSLSSRLFLLGSNELCVFRRPTLVSTQFQQKHTVAFRAQGGYTSRPNSAPPESNESPAHPATGHVNPPMCMADRGSVSRFHDLHKRQQNPESLCEVVCDFISTLQPPRTWGQLEETF